MVLRNHGAALTHTPSVNPARVIDTATAVYHYVDDLAYRQLNGLGLSDPIAQRNAGLPIYGNGAVNTAAGSSYEVPPIID